MQEALNRDRLMEATRRLQSWRPESLTDELAAEMMARGIPFCWSCADWHETHEECSMNDGDQS